MSCSPLKDGFGARKMPMATLKESSYFSCSAKALLKTEPFCFSSLQEMFNHEQRTRLKCVEYNAWGLPMDAHVLNDNVIIVIYLTLWSTWRTYCIYLVPQSFRIVFASLESSCLPQTVFFPKASSPSNKLTSENPVCCGFHRNDGSPALYSLLHPSLTCTQ